MFVIRNLLLDVNDKNNTIVSFIYFVNFNAENYRPYLNLLQVLNISPHELTWMSLLHHINKLG